MTDRKKLISNVCSALTGTKLDQKLIKGQKMLSKATEGCQKVNKGRFINIQYDWQKKLILNVCCALIATKLIQKLINGQKRLSKVTKGCQKINQGRF